MTIAAPSLPAVPSPAGPPANLLASARALETAFLAELLKTAGLHRMPDSLGGGAGEAQFTSFLADAHARALVARGGIGLTAHILHSLQGRGAS